MAHISRKIQQERFELYELLVKIHKEVAETGSFKTLADFVESDRNKAEEVKTGNQKVKQTLSEIKQLQEEIAEAVEERKRDETTGSTAIQRLQEELQELRVIESFI